MLLVSTYELGRQPFGLASPAAWLRRAGAEVTAIDLTRQRLADEVIRGADVVAFYLPMHTATRLALPVIDRVRTLNPHARLAGFGLYAPPNATLLRGHGVAATFGAEFEADLVAFADGAVPVSDSGPARRGGVARLTFVTPDRAGLPPLDRYARLHDSGVKRVAGYTEASRGCKHRCRHCPVVPIYGGHFRIVPLDVVMADVRNQVDAGATHITFGDPDFFNGPAHAARLVDTLHAAHPSLTYDVTIKVEHLLRHAELLPRLRETGCLFVTSAVESMDDAVLARLEKGHTAADVERAVEVCDGAGLPLAPTFVPFTPWTTLEGFCGLLRDVARLGLVESVAPIQLGIRLLVPGGSLLLELPDVRAMVGAFDPTALAYRWRHRDPRVDRLQKDVVALVGRQLTANRPALFDEVWRLAHDAAGTADEPCPVLSTRPGGRRPPVPYLNEPWYC